jgi:hypothetical protein
MTILFDGPVVDGEHKGVDHVPGGVPVMDIDVYSVEGSLAVVNQSAAGAIAPPMLAGESLVVESEWVVENLLGPGVFPGDVYLLFSTAVNREITTSSDTFMTDYDTDFTGPPIPMGEANRAGLIIDPDDGWIFVESALDVMGESTPVFYPAISLGDFMDIGAECGTDPNGNPVFLGANQSCAAIQYFLEDPLANLFPDGPNQVLGLPLPKILMAVIPEPATGSLLGLGLAALAATRRRRR